MKKNKTITGVDESTLEIGRRCLITAMGGKKYRTSPVEKVWKSNRTGMVSLIETQHTIYQIKPLVMVKSCISTNLKVGKSARLLDMNSNLLRTSPVVNCIVDRDGVRIETKHTFYQCIG